MRNRVCKGQPRGAKQEGQGMALRANGAGLGPVIHWLWATGRGGGGQKADSRRNDCQEFWPQGSLLVVAAMGYQERQ